MATDTQKKRSEKNKLSLLAEVTSAVIRLGCHSMIDTIRQECPKSLDRIPHTTECLTREWLSAALCQHHPGAEVESFELGNKSTGSTSRQALHVRYNAKGRELELPEHIFAKATPRLTSRLICTLSGAVECEHAFYTRIRPELDIEAPPSFYTSFDPVSGRSMMLFENIAQTRGCDFLNTEAYINREQAEDMVTLLAQLHGRFWQSPRLAKEFSWLRTPARFNADLSKMIGFEKRSLVGLERAKDIMPPELYARKEDVWPAVLTSLDMNSEHPQTYLHHDVHIGNWYRTGEGRMGLTDWQLNVKGQWASDVAYTLSSALEVENRRNWEEDLIKLYLEQVSRTGAPAPDFNLAWKQYRQQQFHGFAFWLYTIGHGPLQPEMQPDEYSRTNLTRMANAIVDLESLESLG